MSLIWNIPPLPFYEKGYDGSCSVVPCSFCTASFIKPLHPLILMKMQSLTLCFNLLIVYILLSGFTVVSAQPQATVDALMQKGQELLESGSYDEAVRTFTEVISIDSNYTEAYFFRGYTRYKTDDYKSAIQDLDIVLSLDAEYYSVYIYRGLSKCALSDTAGGIDDLTLCIQKADSKDVLGTALNNRGYLYTITGAYNKALTDLSQAISLKKFLETYDVMNLYLKRAYVRQSLHQYDEAIADCNTALEVLEKARNIPTEDSLEFLQDIYYYRTEIYILLEKPAMALLELDKAIALNPNDAFLLNKRAYVQGALGNLKEAIEDYRQVIQLEPTDTSAYYNMAITYIGLEQYAKTREAITKAITVAPMSARFYALRGDMNFKLTDFEDALQDYNTAILYAGSNSEPNYYFVRALIKLELKDREGGCEDFLQAVNMGYEPAKEPYEKVCK